MSIQLGSAYGKIIIDSSGVSAGVGNATKSLGSLTAIAGQVGGAMKNLGAAMTLGLTAPIAAFFASSMKSSMAAEDALAEVNAVIKSTGGAAGVTAEEVQKLAADFQKLTKFSDEQIMSGESMLLTFTNISSEVFPQATEAMLNMAEKFGGMENASIQLGKALNDPIAGVGALRRVGVMLTKEQENQIQTFMAVNDIASAQKVILQELEKEFGGLAVAMGKTDFGKLTKFINTFDDLKELVGKDLIKALIPFIEQLTTIMQKFMDLPESKRNEIVKIVIALGGLAAIAGPIIFALGSIISTISGIVTIAGGLGISFGTVASIAGTVATALVGLAGGAMLLFGQILLLAAGPVLLYLAFKNNFMGITTTIKQLWEIIKFYFGQIGKRITDAFKSINWGQIGKNMLMGLANGMLGGIPLIIGAAIKAAKAAYEAMRIALDSHSPSKKFQKLGEFAGQGFSKGLIESLTTLKKNLNNALNIQLDFFSSYFKDVDSLNKKNTKNHADFMKAQTQATILALAMQAEAMRKYRAAAAKFWSGKGIPNGQSQESINNFLSLASSVPVEQLNNSVPVEQAKPVRVEIIQNFANGITLRQAQELIAANNEMFMKNLSSAIGI